MLLSPPIKRRPQRFIFNKDEYTTVDSMGFARYTIGRLAERLTKATLPFSKIHKDISGYDYCPDISWLGAYYEVKAVGKSNQLFIYKGRLENDIKLHEQREFFYLIWRHGAGVVLGETSAELKKKIITTLKALYIIPFSVVLKSCVERAEIKLNSNYGHSLTNKLYGSGYRMALSIFNKFIVQKFTV